MYVFRLSDRQTCKMRHLPIYMLLCLFATSCQVRHVDGEYSRFFKTEDGTLPFYVFQRLVLKPDSTYTFESNKYFDRQKTTLKDSSFVHGTYSAIQRKLFLKPLSFTTNQFCLHYSSKKIFFYYCDRKPRFKFSVPLRMKQENSHK